MSPLRRWWRAFTAWLHDHSEHACNDCSAIYIRGVLLEERNEELRRKSDEAIEHIVRAGFPRTQDDR